MKRVLLTLFRSHILFLALTTMFPAFAYAESAKIIPYPQKLIQHSGKFIFNKNTTLNIQTNNAEINTLVQEFSNQIKTTSGIEFKNGKNNSKKSNIISFTEDKSIAFEGYKLKITPESVQISASSPNGFFYATQTLYQLLPASVYGNTKSDLKNWYVSCLEIEDAPRFSYRGLHLDVSRHFYPVEYIKKYIDAMAIHKLNRFHWHLTDDQGWRIEIKKYPLLTQIGSQRAETLVGHYYENMPQIFDNKPYGGYYTQEEAREIVRYAASKYITVIPEIEMPGHALAALTAYPDFSCTKQKFEVATKWGIFDDVFCPRDTTFTFLENILSEIIDIFPSEYIHIGGDECPKTRWKACPDCQQRIKSLGLKDEHELQSYFIERIEQFINSKGRKVIGWDEILEGGLAPNATVMSWRGTEGGIAAAKSKHNAIMTPGQFCYFDKYQDDQENEPTAIGGLLKVEDVYDYEPVPHELNADEAKYIIGAQANVWTEYIATSEHLESMIFPRLAAMAEVLWTKPENKNITRFSEILPTQFDRYNKLGINASKAFYNITPKVATCADSKLSVKLNSNIVGSKTHYTLNGSEPTLASSIFKDSIILNENSTIRAQTFLNGNKSGAEFNKTFAVSKVTGYKYEKLNVSSWYNGGSAFALTDGIYGNKKTTSQWTAFIGKTDREVKFTFEHATNISKVTIGMLYFPSMGGLLAPEITVFVSNDGLSYDKVSSIPVTQPNDKTIKIIRKEIGFPTTSTHYLKIVFKYAGETIDVKNTLIASSLFLDEIEVN